MLTCKWDSKNKIKNLLPISFSRDNFWEQFLTSFSKLLGTVPYTFFQNRSSVFPRNVLCIYTNIQSALMSPRFHTCEFAYSLKFTCNPKINTPGTFQVIRGHVLSSRRCESSGVRVPSWGRTRQRCAFSALILITGVLFLLFSAMFSHFSACWCFCCVKRALTIVLNCGVVFLCLGRLWCVYLRRKCVC